MAPSVVSSARQGLDQLAQETQLHQHCLHAPCVHTSVDQSCELEIDDCGTRKPPSRAPGILLALWPWSTRLLNQKQSVIASNVVAFFDGVILSLMARSCFGSPVAIQVISGCTAMNFQIFMSFSYCNNMISSSTKHLIPVISYGVLLCVPSIVLARPSVISDCLAYQRC